MVNTEMKKWDTRVIWSFRRIIYHVTAMKAISGNLSEDIVAQFHDWINTSVDSSIRGSCRQLVGDVFTQIQMMLAMGDNKPEKINFKIDKGYPLREDSLPNTLRYNDLLNMSTFFDIPCVQEVRQYVEEINLQSG